MTNSTHKELLDAALTLKEMARFFAAGMCMDESAVKNNPAILAAEKLVAYHKRIVDEGQSTVRSDSVSTVKKAGVETMPVPAMVPVEPSEPKKTLSIGTVAAGKVKYPMTERGFTHLQVTHVEEDGKLLPVSVETVEDVFLHIKAMPAGTDRVEVAEGVSVKFTTTTGHKEGQIAAAEASFWHESEVAENKKEKMT